jgi:hypothetical protein
MFSRSIDPGIWLGSLVSPSLFTFGQAIVWIPLQLVVEGGDLRASCEY